MGKQLTVNIDIDYFNKTKRYNCLLTKNTNILYEIVEKENNIKEWMINYVGVPLVLVQYIWLKQKKTTTYNLDSIVESSHAKASSFIIFPYRLVSLYHISQINGVHINCVWPFIGFQIQIVYYNNHCRVCRAGADMCLFANDLH